jgi:acetyl-CoA C-acetyltransferase
VARLVSYAGHAQDPVWFTTAPVKAMQNAIHKAGWSMKDVDVFEVNEAFAVVAMAAQKELQIPIDRLNSNGGAISLGHPIGASGARIVWTLIESLRAQSLRRGCASICIGGGEALAVCVELV